MKIVAKDITSPTSATTGLAGYRIEGQKLRVTARARHQKIRVRTTTSTGGKS